MQPHSSVAAPVFYSDLITSCLGICSPVVRREAKTKVSGFYTWLEIRLSGCLGRVCAAPAENPGGPGPDYPGDRGILPAACSSA
jgi:hypothetical protein